MASSYVDYSDYQKFTPPPYEEPPRQRGCFFYGCIIASILSVLLLIAVGLIFFFFYRWFSGMVEQYTATTPRELPRVEMPAEERRTLAERVDAFHQAVEAGKPAEPLVLSSEDLNALIEDRTPWKGKLYVIIEKDRLRGEVSLPASDILDIGITRGRYLNGEADLKVSLEDGVLHVTIDSFEINGQRPPEELLTSLRSQNLAKDAYKDARNAEEIRKLESIEIKDGKLIIKARDREKGKAGAKPADGPQTEPKEGKAIVHPPDHPEKKPGSAGDAGPGDRKLPDDVLAPSGPRPTPPAEPAKKP